MERYIFLIFRKEKEKESTTVGKDQRCTPYVGLGLEGKNGANIATATSLRTRSTQAKICTGHT